MVGLALALIKTSPYKQAVWTRLLTGCGQIPARMSWSGSQALGVQPPLWTVQCPARLSLEPLTLASIPQEQGSPVSTPWK